jgi:hypothetical protein
MDALKRVNEIEMIGLKRLVGLSCNNNLIGLWNSLSCLPKESGLPSD